MRQYLLSCNAHKRQLQSCGSRCLWFGASNDSSIWQCALSIFYLRRKGVFRFAITLIAK